MGVGPRGVGRKLGARVGTFEGFDLKEGDVVGLLVAEGARVVGTTVGVRVGNLVVGEADGTNVGENVGEPDAGLERMNIVPHNLRAVFLNKPAEREEQRTTLFVLSFLTGAMEEIESR